MRSVRFTWMEVETGRLQRRRGERGRKARLTVSSRSLITLTPVGLDSGVDVIAVRGTGSFAGAGAATSDRSPLPPVDGLGWRDPLCSMTTPSPSWLSSLAVTSSTQSEFPPFLFSGKINSRHSGDSTILSQGMTMVSVKAPFMLVVRVMLRRGG